MKLLEENGAILFCVRVIPRSSRSVVVGEQDGVLKVRLTAPPVDGAGNTELVKLIARTLGVSRSAVQIVSGETSRTKRVRVAGITTDHFLKAITP
jgi:uncharacterized protein